MLKDLYTYFRKLLGHWVALVTGPALSLILDVWERWQGVSVPFAVYLAIIGTSWFIAGFLAWRDQHETSSDLEMEDGPQVAIGVVNEQGDHVLELKNVGTLSAFNIRLRRFGLGDRWAIFDPVSEIDPGQSARPDFKIEGVGPIFQQNLSTHLDSIYQMKFDEEVEKRRALQSSEVPITNEVLLQHTFQLLGHARLVIPVAVEYRSFGGRHALTHYELLYRRSGDIQFRLLGEGPHDEQSIRFELAD